MSMRVPYLSSDLYRPLAVHCMLGVINVSAAHVLLTLTLEWTVAEIRIQRHVEVQCDSNPVIK